METQEKREMMFRRATEKVNEYFAQLNAAVAKEETDSTESIEPVEQKIAA